MLRTDLLTLGTLNSSQINQERDKIGLRFKHSMFSNVQLTNSHKRLPLETRGIRLSVNGAICETTYQ